MAKKPIEYFTREDLDAIDKAVTFEELLDIALMILEKMPHGAGIVCGPITTGGTGSRAKNLEKLNQAIEKLDGAGANIFTQMPFEKTMERILGMPHYRGGLHLLEAFYLPLFESGFIQTFYFLPDWQTSIGASWEHRQAVRLKKVIIYL